MTRRYIGLIGKNGSGKSTVAAYLKEKGFMVVSLSDMVREEATRLGRTHSRDDLTHTGNELKEAHGQAVLAERAIDKVDHLEHPLIAFDSIRNAAEADALKAHHVTLIGVEVPVEVRFARTQERRHSTDHVDYETFLHQDHRESKGVSSGQNIDSALELCDVVIENTGTILQLQQQLNNVLGL